MILGKNKRKLMLALGVVFYLVFLYLFLTRIKFSDLSLVFSEGMWLYLVLAVLACAIMIVMQSWLIKSVFQLFQISLSFKDAVVAWLLMVATGFVTAGISGPAVLYYFARKNQNRKTSGALVGVFYLFYMAPPIALALIVGLITLFQSNHFTNLVAGRWLDLILLISCLAIFILVLYWLEVNKKIRNIIRSILFKKIDPKEKMLVPKISFRRGSSLFLVSALEVLFNLVIFGLVLAAFSFHQGLFMAVKNFVVFEVLAIFSPSGGGLGFADLGLTGSLVVSGFSSHLAYISVFAYRLINFWLPLSLGSIIFLVKGRYWLKKN